MNLASQNPIDDTAATLIEGETVGMSAFVPKPAPTKSLTASIFEIAAARVNAKKSKIKEKR